MGHPPAPWAIPLQGPSPGGQHGGGSGLCGVAVCSETSLRGTSSGFSRLPLMAYPPFTVRSLWVLSHPCSLSVSLWTPTQSQRARLGFPTVFAASLCLSSVKGNTEGELSMRSAPRRGWEPPWGIPLKVSLSFSYRQMASWTPQLLSPQLPW